MLSNYSFTVTIPKFKNVPIRTYKGVTKSQFGKLSYNFQRSFFEDLVAHANVLIEHVTYNPLALESQWVVEKFPTDPSRYHMHGTFYEISVDKMKEIQQLWAQKIGLIHEKQINDCIYITKHHAKWDEYIKKDQGPNYDDDFDLEIHEEHFNSIYGFKGGIIKTT